MTPQGATSLDNPLGTAPGLTARLGRADIYVMPGVPYEMYRMYDEQVAPRLSSGSGVILHRIVHTFGAGESDTAGRIADIMKRTGPVTVGTTVAAGLVSVRIIARGADEAQANRRADETIAEILQRLDERVVGQGDEGLLEVAVGRLLRRCGHTLATAESCTGGLLGQMVTSVPRASDYYLGGFICYDNKAKCDLVGVPERLLAEHGAVSEPVAAALAEGARRVLGSTWGIGVTGIAGPGGGTEEKPVGLVYIALAGPAGTATHRQNYRGLRDIIRLRSSLAALDYLRLELKR
jgi:nicotinamide-nucleotide amidase